MLYVGMTQNLTAAREYMLQQRKGMYPDVEMGPFLNKEEALDYIAFMKNRFSTCIRIELPEFPPPDRGGKWWVFSFEIEGELQ